MLAIGVLMAVLVEQRRNRWDFLNEIEQEQKRAGGEGRPAVASRKVLTLADSSVSSLAARRQ